MAAGYDVVGFAYEAGLHCPACAERRFGPRVWDDASPPIDEEGNEVAPVFLDDVLPTDVCDDCGYPLGEE